MLEIPSYAIGDRFNLDPLAEHPYMYHRAMLMDFVMTSNEFGEILMLVVLFSDGAAYHYEAEYFRWRIDNAP